MHTPYLIRAAAAAGACGLALALGACTGDEPSDADADATASEAAEETSAAEETPTEAAEEEAATDPRMEPLAGEWVEAEMSHYDMTIEADGHTEVVGSSGAEFVTYTGTIVLGDAEAHSVELTAEDASIEPMTWELQYDADADEISANMDPGDDGRWYAFVRAE